MNTQEREEPQGLPERVVDALNLGIRQLDAETLSRLYAARRQAVAALHVQHAGPGLLALKRHPALLALGLGAVLVLAVWLALKEPPAQRPVIQDTSKLDIQLLTGELPPQVFADWSLVTRENVENVCLADS